MGFLGGGHHHQPAHTLRITLRKRQGHHATVGGTHDGVQLLYAQGIHHCEKGGCLIEGAECRECRVCTRWATGGAASPEVVDTQHLPVQRVHAAAVADAGVPPATFFSGDNALCRDTTQYGNHWGPSRASQMPGDTRRHQLPAVVQRQWGSQFNDAVAPRNGDYSRRNSAKRSRHRGGRGIFSSVQGNSPSICHRRGVAWQCWSWHRAAAAGEARFAVGCPGFKGPFPQPVSMEVCILGPDDAADKTSGNHQLPILF